MYRGRFRLGEEATIGVFCFDGNYAPVLPDDCPVAKIFDASGNRVWTGKVPIQDRYGITGLFQTQVYLSPTFAPGQYTVSYSYSSGGGAYAGSDEDNFEVLPGGDTDGITEAMFYYHRPQADYVVQQLSSGKLKKRRNPTF